MMPSRTDTKSTGSVHEASRKSPCLGSSVVSKGIGFLLIASAAANASGFAEAVYDRWVLAIRAELEFIGGLWLLSGFRPRLAQDSVLIACAVLLIWDVARCSTGEIGRPLFGRAASPAWLLLIGDLSSVTTLAVLNFQRTGPDTGERDWHPSARGFAAAIGSASLGVALDWSQFGHFPVVVHAPHDVTTAPERLDYLAYLPEGYLTSRGPWPLIVVLHGSGLVGSDVRRLRSGGLPRRLELGTRIPFVVISPQCPQSGWDVGALRQLFDDLTRRYRLDATRFYLTGESMGGHGVWLLAADDPGRFAAVAPICGRGAPSLADRLAGVPAWVFHGSGDQVVPAGESIDMVDAIREAGGDARLTLYPGVGHDSWTATYANPGLYDWFLSHRNSGSRTSTSPMDRTRPEEISTRKWPDDRPEVGKPRRKQAAVMTDR